MEGSLTAKCARWSCSVAKFSSGDTSTGFVRAGKGRLEAEAAFPGERCRSGTTFDLERGMAPVVLGKTQDVAGPGDVPFAGADRW